MKVHPGKQQVINKRLYNCPERSLKYYGFLLVPKKTAGYKDKKPRFCRGFLNGQLQLISLQTATKPYHQFASDMFKVSTLKTLCKYQSKKGEFYIFDKECT